MCGRFVDYINKATLAVKEMYPAPKLQGGRTMKPKTAKALLQQSIEALDNCKDYFTLFSKKGFPRQGLGQSSNIPEKKLISKAEFREEPLKKY